jgi:hypothetical protein
MVNTFSAISPNKSVFKTNYLKNPFHLFAVSMSFIFIFVLIYTPFLQDVIGTIALSLKDWILILLFSFVPLFYQEIRKILLKGMH